MGRGRRVRGRSKFRRESEQLDPRNIFSSALPNLLVEAMDVVDLHSPSLDRSNAEIVYYHIYENFEKVIGLDRGFRFTLLNPTSSYTLRSEYLLSVTSLTSRSHLPDQTSARLPRKVLERRTISHEFLAQI